MRRFCSKPFRSRRKNVSVRLTLSHITGTTARGMTIQHARDFVLRDINVTGFEGALLAIDDVTGTGLEGAVSYEPSSP